MGLLAWDGTKLQADVSSNSAIACSSRSRSWFCNEEVGPGANDQGARGQV